MVQKKYIKELIMSLLVPKPKRIQFYNFLYTEKKTKTIFNDFVFQLLLYLEVREMF